MREYEFTFVVQPEISDEGITSISDRFEGLLSENGSEKLFYEDWGRRRLAYEIRNFQKGHYRVLHFFSDGKVVPQLERMARLDDSVLRFLTVQVSDDVKDADARRGEAAGFEEERVKRAAERAARDAEEAAREETERAEREAAAQKAAAEAEAKAAEAKADEAKADPGDAADAGDAAAEADSGDDSSSAEADEEKSE